MKRRPDFQFDYYAILGVGSKADIQEIRDAYRRMAKRFHPDVTPPGEDYSKQFRDINNAYNVLGNPQLKREYDKDRAATGDPRWVNFEEFEASPRRERREERREARKEPKPDSGWFDESDDDSWVKPKKERSGLFDKFFGSDDDPKSNEAKKDQRVPDIRHGDLETEVVVTLAEVLRGTTRVINLRRKGSTETPRQFTVEIPSGVPKGHMIRLEGKGRTSLSRGTVGDLYVTVRYAPNHDFEVNGSDIFHTVVLRPWQFVLGDVVSVPTIEDSLKARVPEGSIPGQRLKIRGQGLPRGKRSRGDLVVTLQLEIPQALTTEERVAWERLRDASKRR